MSEIPTISAIVLEQLKAAGYYKFTGVPCSYFESLRLDIEADASCTYIAAAHEGIAVSIAAGLVLSGHKTVVLMQNSGLGNAVNPLSSLLIAYNIPILMIISRRGEPGKNDALHHLNMGEATPGILAALGIDTECFTDAASVINYNFKTLHQHSEIKAFLISKNVFQPAKPVTGSKQTETSLPVCIINKTNHTDSMDIDDTIRYVNTVCGDYAIVATTGFISKSLAYTGYKPNHFYMQGSMGHASAIGAGIASANPRRPVLVLDGDGALLMHLGVMASVGAGGFTRFIHVLLDNGQYASTGGQPLPGIKIDFTAIAAACGYDFAYSCAEEEEMKKAFYVAKTKPGTHFIHLFVSASGKVMTERPEMPPPQLAKHFSDFLKDDHQNIC